MTQSEIVPYPVSVAMHRHRSIRRYMVDDVPEEMLDDILGAGIRASSSGNMQTYSIIVTRDEALREALYVPHMEQEMVVDAPVLLTFCADFRRMRHWLRLNEAPDNFDDFMAFMIGTIDAVLVSQNVALAAEERGLGICYLGSTLANCDEIGALLNCPPGVVPVTGFSLGYPAEDPAPRDRLPLAGLVHRETYHDYSDEQIRAIYHERDVKGWERYMGYPELRRRIEGSGVQNLAQIYTILKYTRAEHQEYSRTILDYLIGQGFLGAE
jgi:nitroreductase